MFGEIVGISCKHRCNLGFDLRLKKVLCD
jgi:hypothetical protein